MNTEDHLAMYVSDTELEQFLTDKYYKIENLEQTIKEGPRRGEAHLWPVGTLEEMLKTEKQYYKIASELKGLRKMCVGKIIRKP